MLFVITGDGKGKTTSALGMVARAEGQGMKCAVLQFIKADPSALGEYKTFSKLGVSWESWGDGFTWNVKDVPALMQKCEKGWDSFVEKALSGKYCMLVLDEFTYVLTYGYLDQHKVVSFLSENKNREGFPHVVITGREAPKEIVDLADTVSEIQEIKHHYHTNGGKAIKGIEL